MRSQQERLHFVKGLQCLHGRLDGSPVEQLQQAFDHFWQDYKVLVIIDKI